MHFLLFLMLLIGSCLAHYRSSQDTRNFIIREEPLPDDDGEYVECPVCDESDHWSGRNERCPFKQGNKTYKKCWFGTYINEVCGGKEDCYSGPGEQCTVKREFDTLGKKCAPGLYCNKLVNECTGLTHTVDSNTQWHLNHYPYSVRRTDKYQRVDEPKYFKGTLN